MVIDKFLKVNSTDPKAEELRKRLAALQQQAQGTPAPSNAPPRMGPTQPPTGAAPAPRPVINAVSTMDADLQRMGFAEQKNLVQTREPEVRLKEERTLALVMTQIQEVITLQNDSAKKIRELDAKNLQLEKSLEIFKGKHEELLQKMNGIDSRLEKFMGLYEIVTAQYNPFTVGQALGGTRTTAQLTQTPQHTPPPTTSFTDTLKEQLAEQKAAQNKTPTAKANEFAVEDSLTKEKTVVTVKAEDAAAADARFKRVEELLADLHEKHSTEQANSVTNHTKPTTDTPQAVSDGLHTFLAGFEDRLTKQLDASLQMKIHERFTKLETSLQGEIRDALRNEIEAVQRDEDTLQAELLALQNFVHANEGPSRDAVEHELGALQHQLSVVRDDIKAINPEMYFRTVDGHVLRNLTDLRDALTTLAPHVFAHHVRADGNDFASWVEHALKSPTLAELMREQHSALDMAHAIVAHEGMSK